MKADLIRTLTDNFEAHAQQADNGIEFWLARDIQHLLGYTEWRNFTAVISKAKTACEAPNHAISTHFVDVDKMVDIDAHLQPIFKISGDDAMSNIKLFESKQIRIMATHVCVAG